MRREFLGNIHYFRGFAILNIMLWHLLLIPKSFHQSAAYSFFTSLRVAIFASSTIYFIFISGFLFFYLSENFSHLKFYQSKVKRLLIPYSFMTLLFTLKASILEIIAGEISFVEFSRVFLDSLLLGTAQHQFWYIPFALLLFLVSPLFLKIINERLRSYLWLLFIIPFFGEKTVTPITIKQYIYFLPMFVIGMYTAYDYKNIMKTLKIYLPQIIALVVFTTTILFFYATQKVNFYGINVIGSLFYIQKISLSFAAIVLLEKVANKKLNLLDLFAKYSFPLFFLHFAFYNSKLINYLYRAAEKIEPILIIPSSILFSLASIFAGLAISIAIHRTFKRKSVFIIGT